VVPVIAQLLEQCSATKYAYLCHPRVHHISKLKKEGKAPHLCEVFMGVVVLMVLYYRRFLRLSKYTDDDLIHQRR